MNKSLAQAESAGNGQQAESLRAQLDALGGLETYQQASIQGQESRRGGDSSVVLVDWLKPTLETGGCSQKLKLLEVGALSNRNACSLCGFFYVERIDLNSQGDGIIKQDFMERPIPNSATNDYFDIISLSLVVNFVPDLAQRGEMLRRVTRFLTRTNSSMSRGANLLPALFLVLPAPCVTNSRYMTELQLAAIMESLGFCLSRRKQSTKLIYYLWQWKEAVAENAKQNFPKVLLNDGRSRNNFSIVLNPES